MSKLDRLRSAARDTRCELDERLLAQITAKGIQIMVYDITPLEAQHLAAWLEEVTSD